MPSRLPLLPAPRGSRSRPGLQSQQCLPHVCPTLTLLPLSFTDKDPLMMLAALWLIQGHTFIVSGFRKWTSLRALVLMTMVSLWGVGGWGG